MAACSGTEDIGALTLPADHSMTLKSRIFDNLLQWDTGCARWLSR